MSENGLNAETLEFFRMMDDPNVKAAIAKYDEKIVDVKKKYNEMENYTIGIIEKDYHSQQLVQQNISRKYFKNKSNWLLYLFNQ